METNREIKPEEEIEKLKKELEKSQEKQEHYKKQIGLAVGLRYHLMPGAYPLFTDIPEVDVYADQIGIAKTGGDFFDMFRIDADHIGIVMADIFDGGEEAALYMVAFKLYLSGELSMGFSPSKLIEVVNNRLASYNEDNLCMSAFYGVYEVSTGTITAVNASGDCPIVLHNGNIGLCKEDRKSYLLAVIEGMTYEEYTFKLEPGDALLLYTDGAIRARNSAGEELGVRRLIDSFARAKDMNAEETVGEIQGDFFDFIGDKPLADDASFLCLRRTTDIEPVGREVDE